MMHQLCFGQWYSRLACYQELPPIDDLGPNTVTDGRLGWGGCSRNISRIRNLPFGYSGLSYHHEFLAVHDLELDALAGLRRRAGGAR
jgi:hypothetical protein